MVKVSKVVVGKDLKEAIVKAVDGVGGLIKFIKTGDVVFLKPNFNTADPFPASTDLAFLETVSDLIYDHGAKLTIIGESSTVTLNSRKVMEKIGVFALQEKKRPPRIYVLEEEKWAKRKIPNGKYLKSAHISELINRVDKLIFLPCLKTHEYAQFTGSLKLSMGLMKPYQRFPMHMRNLQEKIAELSTLFNPALIIMDARKCFINRGPSEGELREPNLIMASSNRVDIDVEGIKIIQSYKGNSLSGIDPLKLPQIKRAMDLSV